MIVQMLMNDVSILLNITNMLLEMYYRKGKVLESIHINLIKIKNWYVRTHNI